jgi:small conductance mechanosensitive channel
VALSTLTLLAADQPHLAADQPSPSKSCLDDPVCNVVYKATDSSWFADSSYYILVKPLRIVLIVLAALLVRFLLHKTINRLVRSTSKAQVPTILRPLRERAPRPDGPPVPFPERRRQRAEAIGSVLRNTVSVVVFSVAGLTILGELNFDLGPLLASAGIVGLALGFGAQTLVKDLLAGLFMLVEDQYGVGDTVDLGEATGVVEAIGLRITTVRDGHGVVWYIRNGEIVRVGNKSQGWATVIVDMPIGFASVEEATTLLRRAVDGMAHDPQYEEYFVEPPEVLGVEQVTVDGAVLRTVAKTTADGQYRVQRELRRRQAEALEEAGITAQIAAARLRPVTPRPPVSQERSTQEPPGDERG